MLGQRRGYLIVNRAGDRVYVATGDKVGICTGSKTSKVTVVGDPDATVGGAELSGKAMGTQLPGAGAGCHQG